MCVQSFFFFMNLCFFHTETFFLIPTSQDITSIQQHFQLVFSCQINTHPLSDPACCYTKLLYNTCDKTRDKQWQHQHLEHSHQQLSRKGEVLHFTVRQFVWTQRKSEDYTCREIRCGGKGGKLWYSTQYQKESSNTAQPEQGTCLFLSN